MTKIGAERMINSRALQANNESQSLSRYRASSRKPTDPNPMATVQPMRFHQLCKEVMAKRGEGGPFERDPQQRTQLPQCNDDGGGSNKPELGERKMRHETEFQQSQCDQHQTAKQGEQVAALA